MRQNMPPTARQQAVLKFIALRCSTGLPPTIREIGEAFGIKSPNGVVTHLAALVGRKLLDRDEMDARGMRLVGARFVLEYTDDVAGARLRAILEGQPAEATAQEGA